MTEHMDVIFVTHNELGRRCIAALDDLGANVQAVYTRPEAGHISDQVDLRSIAVDADADFHRVEGMNADAVVSRLRTYSPDLLFIVGWSELVESRVIETATIEAFGMHPAPLPRGRGRAPVAWTLIKGLERTELVLFGLVEAADSGDVFGRQSIDITLEDDARSVNEKIHDAGETLVRTVYPQLVNGSVAPSEQADGEATWWPRRRPHHGLIDWNQSALDVHNWIRGQSDPYPGAFSYLDGSKVIAWGTTPPTGESVFARPGELLERRGDRLAVAAWEEAIELTRVQVRDDERIPASELVESYDFEIGDVFTNARDFLMDERD